MDLYGVSLWGPLWGFSMGSLYGVSLWGFSMDLCGVSLWGPFMGFLYGFPYGVFLWGLYGSLYGVSVGPLYGISGSLWVTLWGLWVSMALYGVPLPLSGASTRPSGWGRSFPPLAPPLPLRPRPSLPPRSGRRFYDSGGRKATERNDNSVGGRGLPGGGRWGAGGSGDPPRRALRLYGGLVPFQWGYGCPPPPK